MLTQLVGEFHGLLAPCYTRKSLRRHGARRIDDAWACNKHDRKRRFGRRPDWQPIAGGARGERRPPTRRRRQRPIVAPPHGDGGARGDAKGRRQPRGPDARGYRGACTAGHMGPRPRLHGGDRRLRQPVHAAARLDGRSRHCQRLPQRHPAHRRPLRRYLRRAVRGRGTRGHRRRGHRHQPSARSRDLEQRGRDPLQPDEPRLRRLCRDGPGRHHARGHGPGRRHDAERGPDPARGHPLGRVARTGGLDGGFRRVAYRTGSPNSRPKGSTSASSPPSREPGSSRSRSSATKRTPAPRPSACAATRSWTR